MEIFRRLSVLWRLVLKVFSRRFRNFGIIGIALTVFGAVFIEVAPHIGLSVEMANFIQAVISVVLNFILNYFFTWDDRRSLRMRTRAARFATSKVVTVLLNQAVFVISQAAFFALFGDTLWFLPDHQFAYVVSTGFIMLVNYRLMDVFVFGESSWTKDLRQLLWLEKKDE